MKAIEFKNISKLYRLGEIGTGTLSHDLNRWYSRLMRKDDPYLKIGEENIRSEKKGTHDYVWALNNINFDVEQGDVVGIIGNNGAGKSTLLKLLSKVTAPTTGTIKYRGRIASLLEVGTGFHPEMTGKENIYMNGAIMGMTKKEIDRKYDEIVDFSGVGKYIDTPTKRYSSGMIVRLGFAISAFLEQEILVVDEVLAVGDAEFQKKAIGKMQNVSKNEGRTVLFVSHNMQAIQNLCNTGILLGNGTVRKIDEINSVINYYLKQSDNLTNDVEEVNITSKNRRKTGTMNVEFTNIKRLNDFTVSLNETLSFLLTFRINDKLRTDMRIVGMINDINGQRVGLFFSPYFSTINKDKIFSIKVDVDNTFLTSGTYTMDFNVTSGDIYSGFSDIDVVYKTVNFVVKYYDFNKEKIISNWQPQWGHNCYLDVKIKES